MTEIISAILPMRAGSQRVKNKNIRPIKGIPLYEYILHVLLSVYKIDKIVINTDITEVLSKYKGHKRIILLEREERLKDNCSMNLVIEDTLKKVSGDYFIQVHATNPLLRSETFEQAIKAFFNRYPQYDSLFSVTRVQKRYWKEDWTPLNHDPMASPTTQDLPPLFEENSCFYIFNRSVFMRRKNRIGEKPYLFEIDVMESFDIDTEAEFAVVEKLLS